jgi:hypothetical protein
MDNVIVTKNGHLFDFEMLNNRGLQGELTFTTRGITVNVDAEHNSEWVQGHKGTGAIVCTFGKYSLTFDHIGRLDPFSIASQRNILGEESYVSDDEEYILDYIYSIVKSINEIREAQCVLGLCVLSKEVFNTIFVDGRMHKDNMRRLAKILPEFAEHPAVKGWVK